MNTRAKLRFLPSLALSALLMACGANSPKVSRQDGGASPDVCLALDAREATVWSKRVQQDVASGISSAGNLFATEVKDRLVQQLDAQMKFWQDTKARICAAPAGTATLSDAQFRQTSRCLDDSLTQMEILTDTLKAPDGKQLQKTPWTIESMGDYLHTCQHVEGYWSYDGIFDNAEALRIRKEILKSHTYAELSDDRAGIIIKKLKKELNNETPLQIQVLVLLAHSRQAFEKGEFATAGSDVETALTLAEEAGFLAGIAVALTNAGAFNGVEGHYQDAIALCQKGLAIVEEIYGKTSYQAARVLHNMTEMHRGLSQYENALSIYSKLPELYETAPFPVYLRLAEVLAGEGYIYSAMGKYDKALSQMEKALTIIQTELGATHPEVAIQLNHLGRTYADMTRFPEAVDIHTTALEIQRATIGESHPEVANTYMLIGKLYSHMKLYDEAIELLETALDIHAALAGEDAPIVASCHMLLGDPLVGSGDWDAAKAHLEKAIEIFSKKPGGFHGALCNAHMILGYLYMQQDQFEPALNQFDIILAIQEETVGTTHPDYAGYLMWKATAYAKAKQYESALQTYRRALKIIKAIEGANPLVSSTIEQQIQQLCEQGYEPACENESED